MTDPLQPKYMCRLCYYNSEDEIDMLTHLACRFHEKSKNCIIQSVYGGNL